MSLPAICCCTTALASCSAMLSCLSSLRLKVCFWTASSFTITNRPPLKNGTLVGQGVHSARQGSHLLFQAGHAMLHNSQCIAQLEQVAVQLAAQLVQLGNQSICHCMLNLAALNILQAEKVAGEELAGPTRGASACGGAGGCLASHLGVALAATPP